jgi:signal peptidase II
MTSGFFNKNFYINFSLIFLIFISDRLSKIYIINESLIILVIILAILYMIIQNTGLRKYSLIFVFSGALGNFYDRIFYGAVPDFIDFHINNFHWFIFNLADIFISVGVLLMIVLEIFDKNNYEKN